MSFDFGSFLLGRIFFPRANTTEITQNHHVDIHIPVQYPDNWGEYSNEEKLKWLEDRKYWREYYELKSSLKTSVHVDINQNNDDIKESILQSVLKNKGDLTEAQKLLENYLAEKFQGECISEQTEARINYIIGDINNYLKRYKNDIEFWGPLKIFRKFTFS